MKGFYPMVLVSSFPRLTLSRRINSPSLSYVILLHHQLLTASAHLRHRSRMQCNAGACKTALAHFWAHLFRASIGDQDD